MQNPLKGWCAKYVSESGEINWALACPYQLEWPDRDPTNAAGPTSATGMTFVGGCYQALIVSIDTSFQFIDPWDVFKARLHKEGNPPINYVMSQFFPVGHGPNSSLISNKGSELEAGALKAKAKFEQARKTMDDARVSDENFLGEERKKAQGEKLKAIHATNQENAKRRRTVSVAPPRDEAHTAGGTPVLVLEAIFEAAADMANWRLFLSGLHDSSHWNSEVWISVL